MASGEINQTLRRAGQLNALAYLIIMVLLAMIGVLAFTVVADLRIPDIWVLSDQIVRVLFFGLVLMVVLYMVDQHRRVRAELVETHKDLEVARNEIQSAYDRLSFAQHTATIMSSLTAPDALPKVLSDSTQHFGADASAVVGDEITLFAEPGVDTRTAEETMVKVAMDAVSAGIATASADSSIGGHAIAVPLRIKGALKSVVCVWRSSGQFAPDTLEGLVLVARIIELALENRLLVRELDTRLQGTLNVLGRLLDERVPDNAAHSTRVAEYAVATARALGLKAEDVDALRIAALISDVGLLSVRDYVARGMDDLSPDEVRELKMHPVHGARAAREAGLGEAVESTIRDHHEMLDGSGYPYGRSGESISMLARILAVCNAFDDLTYVGADGVTLTIRQALRALDADTGRLYDPQALRGLAVAVAGDAALRRRFDMTADLMEQAIPA